MEPVMEKHFDAVLEKVGSYGRYQKLLLYCYLLPVNFFSAFMVHKLVFELVVPEHWCHVPGRVNTSLAPVQRSGSGRPEGASSCYMYEVTSGGPNNSFAIANTNNPCRFGWEYDTTQFEATVATSYGWFCEQDYSSHILALNMAGHALGALVLPIAADKFAGRCHVAFLAFVLHAVFTAPLLLLPPVGIHLLLRFLAGLAYPTMATLPTVIGFEVVKSDKRAFIATLCNCAWIFGACITSLVAYLVPRWQHLATLSCLPPILSLISWRLVPESPRFLLSRGRMEECVLVLQQIARVNRRIVHKSELKTALNTLQAEPVTTHISKVFHYPRLRLMMVCLVVLAICFNITYGIIFLGINIMPSNYILSHFVITSFELPGCLLSLLTLHYLGRRFTFLASSLLTAIMCLVSFSFHDELQLMIVSGIINISIGAGFQAMFVMVPEVFPTAIRSSFLGMYYVFSCLSLIVAPYIIHSNHSVSLRFYVMLGLMVIAVVAALPLPETLGLALPQTFQEAENLGSGRPLTKWIHHWNQHKYHSRHSHTRNPEALTALQAPLQQQP